jgi:hypothetical protein
MLPFIVIFGCFDSRPESRAAPRSRRLLTGGVHARFDLLRADVGCRRDRRRDGLRELVGWRSTVPPGCRASNRPDPGGRAVGRARCRGLQQPQRRHLGHERQRQRAAARYALRGRVRLRPEPLAQRPLDRLPHVAVWAFSILVAISLIDQVEVAKLTQAEQSSGEAFAWRPATTPTLPHLSRDAEFVDRPCGAESEQAVHLPAPTCTAIECGAYLTMLTIATFSVCAASFATLANTSAGVACPATSVATRRSAVCSSARSRASRSLAILGGSLS